ncbi:AsmA-like C-terminal region-containing protein [Aureispira anguillae]|uniref:AsmA family protein n=1 Tax=Aureispira anguillae TaxID=2864201 RepID=A0A915YHI1_9BACT|nr:AsmA-like C-terminal region-containing protein [Aureispira anguillae]BDS13155.1 AsmA family protein [Aureispira anguillae]
MAKIGKVAKRILKFIGFVLVLIIGLLIAIPYFYKNEILDAAKEFANEQINATLDFDNDKVGLSLLWTFPDFSFSIGDLSVTGHDEFEGKKLADIGTFYFTINLMDVYRGQYKINGVTLSDADLYVKVLRNGKANYDIMKPSDAPVDEPTTTTTSSGSNNMQLTIKHWGIENTNIIYDDEPSELYVELKNLNHEGSGDFTTSVFDLETTTKIDEFTVAMNRIAYLKKADVAIDFNANIDLNQKVYKIMDNSFRFNALTLNLDGEVAQPSADDFKLDLKFNTPNTAFSSVLSMIPAAYTKDFSEVETKGDFKLSGYVKGILNTVKEKMPAFAIDFGVKDAEFKYPDLPLPVEEINTQIAVKSTSSDFDKMTVDVSKFHIKVGRNPFDAMLKLRTPISDPDVDAKIDGTIDLTELGKAFPMEGVSELSGLIKANLETKTKMSYINKSQYNKVDMKGLLIISNMNYAATNLPPVKINTMAMNFTPNNVDLRSFDLKIGKSDIKASGKLDNILTYFSRDKIMRGNLSVSSNLLDLNEIANFGASTETTTAEPVAENENLATAMQDTTTAVDAPVFDRFQFAMDMNFKNIKYDVHEIKNLETKGRFSPATAVLEDLKLVIGKVDLRAKGKLENVFGYLFDEEIINGELTLYSNYMNLNQFMSEDGEAVEKAAEIETVPEDVSQVENDLEPMQIPGNVDFTLYTTFKTLIYDTYKLKNVQAEAHVHDHILDINALRADAFGGGLAMNGKYDTQDPKKPKFKFGYDVSKLDIQAIAKEVGLSKRFLPILESVYGKFNSKFEVNGILDENLYPDLASLSAKGILKTFNTTIKNNKSVSQLSDKLKIGGLNQLDLGNTTNFFTVKDGRLTIDPASYVVKGMDVIFGGSHGLDNSMDYDMKMRVPRTLLANNAVGAAANNALSAGLGALAPQAQKLGINLKDSEYLNVNVGIGGTVAKPKFKVNLLGAEGKGGKNIGGQAADLLKQEAQKVKDEMEAKAKAEADRLKKEAEAQLQAEADRLKKEAEERAKKLAAQAAKDPGSVVDSLKNIDPGKIIKDPSQILKDPGNLGGLLGGKKKGDDKKGDDKKTNNPFGKFKNPFGPK